MIVVLPEELDAAGQVSAGVADTASGVRGTYASGAVGEGGCQAGATGAFAAMQHAWTAQLAYLAECDNGLAQALGNAAQSYPTTDAAQMLAVWQTASAR